VYITIGSPIRRGQIAIFELRLYEIQIRKANMVSRWKAGVLACFKTNRFQFSLNGDVRTELELDSSRAASLLDYLSSHTPLTASTLRLESRVVKKFC